MNKSTLSNRWKCHINWILLIINYDYRHGSRQKHGLSEFMLFCVRLITISHNHNKAAPAKFTKCTTRFIQLEWKCRKAIGFISYWAAFTQKKDHSLVWRKIIYSWQNAHTTFEWIFYHISLKLTPSLFIYLSLSTLQKSIKLWTVK